MPTTSPQAAPGSFAADDLAASIRAAAIKALGDPHAAAQQVVDEYATECAASIRLRLPTAVALALAASTAA